MGELDSFVHQYLAGINDRDWERVGDLLAESAVHHHSGGQALGREAIISFYESRCDLMDWTVELQAFATTAEWITAVHRNVLPNGHFDVVTSARVSGGRAREIWTVGMPIVGLTG
jgi:hypothetical protein